MSSPRLLRLAVGLVVVAASVVLVRVLGDDAMELTATYDQVGDLVEQGHVRFGDVPVGTISDIELTGEHRARVTMSIDADARVPERAVAVVRMTAVLGERYVDLVPAPDDGVEVTDGAQLPGRYEHDIELLVEAGSDVLGALSADRVARVIEVGHRTFDGRGERLGELLDDLGDYADHVEREREQLADFIDASERLAATLGPDAELHAAALEDLADLTEVLAEEEERLVGAMDELAGTAEVGARIVSDNRESLDDLLGRVGRLTAEVLRVDQALENLLLWLPRHNIRVPGGVMAEHAQVLNDFTICGVNDEPENPSNSCDPPNPGQPNDPAPGFRITACTLYNVGCEGFPEGVQPYRAEAEEARTTEEERQRKVDQAEGTAHYERRPREPAPRGLP